MRKSLELIGQLFDEFNLSDWRQFKYHVKCIKRLYRNAQQAKRKRGDKADEQIQTAHQNYLDTANGLLPRIETSLQALQEANPSNIVVEIKVNEIQSFIEHAKQQINQIERRVIHGEIIPHEEKVFSLFQPHTEWICKGKAGVPVELGVKVGIIEDHYQFILHHRVMYQESDVEVAVPMTQRAKEMFPGMHSISYDKGYYSSDNRGTLTQLLTHVSLPKKGKLSNKDREIQEDDSYRYAKEKHSAVESAINALEVHGLDQCLDHGTHGFSRYVAIAIASRNLQRVGAILHQREQDLFLKRERRKRELKKVA